MTDQGIRLYKAITDIDDTIIEEAEYQETPGKSRKVFYAALIAAAAACVILAGILLFSGVIRRDGSKDITAGGGITAGDAMTGGDIQTGGVADAAVRDYSPIAYKDLALPEANETLEFAGLPDTSAAMCIAAFDESFLSDCCGILEGKILQIYPKEYDVNFYDDKFGEVQLFYGKSFSIVYELEIENVWYGEDFAAGETLLIEDEYYQLNPLASLMEGRTYVIPIYECGEEISEAAYSAHELAPGDFTRDSIYSTIYPYHPQITRTEDGNYLLTSDWQTLAAEPCREVIINGADFDTGEEYSDYQDGFRLVYGDDFAERLSLLIQEQLGEEK